MDCGHMVRTVSNSAASVKDSRATRFGMGMSGNFTRNGYAPDNRDMRFAGFPGGLREGPPGVGAVAG